MPLAPEQRQRIVDVALSWTGTPYRGWTCKKGVGADCGQFLRGVFIEAGFFREIPAPANYSLQAAQHRHTSEYRDIVETYMRPIAESEVLPGDVVLFKVGKGFAHSAIVKSWPDYVIHSLERYGVTAGHATANSRFARLPKLFYTLKDEYCEVTR